MTQPVPGVRVVASFPDERPAEAIVLTCNMSHRWGWPNGYDSRMCACGATYWIGKNSGYQNDYCRFYSPALRLMQREDGHRQNFWSTNSHIDHTVRGDNSAEWVPPPSERLRCERADLPYEPPNTQADWLAEAGEYREANELRRIVEQRARDVAMQVGLAAQGRAQTALAARSDLGGIVRLGCELRKADGVTPIK